MTYLVIQDLHLPSKCVCVVTLHGSTWLIPVLMGVKLLRSCISLTVYSVVWGHFYQTWPVPGWSLQIHCVYS